MKIVICCEGPNDIGPLSSFIKRCGNSKKIDVECETHKSIKRIKQYRTKRNGRKAMIFKLYVLALLKGSNRIGYHQDADDNDFFNVYNDIKNDFVRIIPDTVKCIPIIPQKTTEAWLLSDEHAYPKVPKKPSLPLKPENIWGARRDTDSDHPKKYFIRVMSQFDIIPNRNTYTKIAENSNIEVLKRRCPISFGRFYKDIRSLIAE